MLRLFRPRQDASDDNYQRLFAVQIGDGHCDECSEQIRLEISHTPPNHGGEIVIDFEYTNSKGETVAVSDWKKQRGGSTKGGKRWSKNRSWLSRVSRRRASSLSFQGAEDGLLCHEQLTTLSAELNPTKRLSK